MTSSEKVYLFKQANFDSLNRFFNGICWDEIFSSLSVKAALEQFYNIVYAAIDNYVPTKIIFKNTCNYPKWFNCELIQVIKDKRLAHSKFKLSGRTEDYLTFSKLRSIAKQMSSQLYDKYLKETEQILIADPRKFWSYVKELRKENGLPKVLKLGNLTSSDTQTVADLFAAHFKTVYTDKHDSKDGFFGDVSYTHHGLGFLADLKFHISLENVFDLLSSLKFDNICGPDKLTGAFLASCKYSLSKPISLLFDRSLSEGIFPQLWKLSFVKPIFK